MEAMPVKSRRCLLKSRIKARTSSGNLFFFFPSNLKRGMDKVISGISLDWGSILKAYLKSRGFRHLDWWVGITKARGNQSIQVGEDDAVKEVTRPGRMVGEGVRRWVILGSGFHGGEERESHRQRSWWEEPTNSKTSEVGRWSMTCSSAVCQCV